MKVYYRLTLLTVRIAPEARDHLANHPGSHVTERDRDPHFALDGRRTSCCGRSDWLEFATLWTGYGPAIETDVPQLYSYRKVGPSQSVEYLFPIHFCPCCGKKIELIQSERVHKTVEVGLGQFVTERVTEVKEGTSA